MAHGSPAIPPQDSPIGSSVRGRSDAPEGGVNANLGHYSANTQCTSRQGTVVIRATVEQIGLAGDTEMTVSVKWPASSFCIQPCAQSPAPREPGPISPNVPANGPVGRNNFDPGILYGESEPDLGPETEETTQARAEEQALEGTDGKSVEISHGSETQVDKVPALSVGHGEYPPQT